MILSLRFHSYLVSGRFVHSPRAKQRKDFYMNKNKKAIDMTPEELNEWLASLPAPQDDALCTHFSDPDPYFKMEHTSREQSENRLFNKDGHLTVRNYCAAELPKITMTIHSGQTTYRFSGSYDGTRSLSSKLLDHMAKEN
jgi:hypothetical protein